VTAPCVVSSGTVIEDFSDSTQWTKDSYGGTPGNWYDSTIAAGQRRTYFKHAYPSAASTATWTKTISLDLSSLYTPAMALKVWVPHQYYLGSWSMISRVGVQFSSTTDFSKYFSWEYNGGLRHGLQRLIIGSADWTNTGSESWSNTMIRMRVYIRSVLAGYQEGCFFQELRGGWHTEPAVLFGFDDWEHDAMQVLDDMTSLGVAGTFEAQIEDLNGFEEPTSQDLLDLSAAGWTPLLPSSPVPFYANIPHATFVDQVDMDIYRASLEQGTQFLLNLGVPVVGHVGVMPRTTPWHASVMRQLGMRSFWTNGSHPFNGPLEDSMAYTLPVNALSVAGGDTLVSAKAELDAAVARGSMIFFSTEDFTGVSNGWYASDWMDLIEYAQGTAATVMTADEFITFATDPAGAHGGGLVGVWLGVLNLNDGESYFVDNEGVNLGNRQTVWDEVVSYSATANAQVNVRRANLIPVTLPMIVKGVSKSDLDDKLAALWVEVDKVSNMLLFDDETYTIGRNTRPDTIERDPYYQFSYAARFTLVLMREP
jgi:hypothetical protein